MIHSIVGDDLDASRYCHPSFGSKDTTDSTSSHCVRSNCSGLSNSDWRVDSLPLISVESSDRWIGDHPYYQGMSLNYSNASILHLEEKIRITPVRTGFRAKRPLCHCPIAPYECFLAIIPVESSDRCISAYLYYQMMTLNHSNVSTLPLEEKIRMIPARAGFQGKSTTLPLSSCTIRFILALIPLESSDRCISDN